jgi:hypothetical protein
MGTGKQFFNHGETDDPMDEQFAINISVIDNRFWWTTTNHESEPSLPGGPFVKYDDCTEDIKDYMMSSKLITAEGIYVHREDTDVDEGDEDDD